MADVPCIREYDEPAHASEACDAARASRIHDSVQPRLAIDRLLPLYADYWLIHFHNTGSSVCGITESALAVRGGTQSVHIDHFDLVDCDAWHAACLYAGAQLIPREAAAGGARRSAYGHSAICSRNWLNFGLRPQRLDRQLAGGLWDYDFVHSCCGYLRTSIHCSSFLHSISQGRLQGQQQGDGSDGPITWRKLVAFVLASDLAAGKTVPAVRHVDQLGEGTGGIRRNDYVRW